jgi:hypothetical protein
VTAMAAAVLSITTGLANAATPDHCRMAQDYYELSINELQDATYAGDVSAMRVWLRLFAEAEAEVAISC